MATVKTTEMSNSVKQKYSAGMGLNGKELHKFRTINSINKDATDEQIYQLKNLIDAVVENPTVDFTRQRIFTITEE